MKRPGARAVTFFFAVAVLLFAYRVQAHAIGVSKGDYTIQGSVVTAQITFARGEIVEVVTQLDPDRSGHISSEALARTKGDIERLVLGRIVVFGDGQKCAAKLDDVALTELDGIALRGHYDCPSLLAKLAIDVDLLSELSHGHRHISHVVAGSVTVDEVCYRGHSGIEVPVVTQESRTNSERASLNAGAFLRMGLEHILTGYDHLVFLFGLILVGGRIRSLIGVITAFTAAHSITLALATLDVWSPSPRWIEPAIALSIAYVGFENFYVKSAERRWRITFPFGLIHGFGFAGALREINLPRPQIPAALVLFNAGVEVGQLAALAALLPLVLWLRKRGWFATYGVNALSAAIVVAGFFWFLKRVRHPQ